LTPQVKLSENRDPRLSKSAVFTKKPAEKPAPVTPTAECEVSKPSPIFNKLQQVLNSGFKNGKQAKPAKFAYSIEKNGVKINRTKAPPSDQPVLEAIDKSDIIRLHQSEPNESDFTQLIAHKTDWIEIDAKNKLIPNERLRKMLLKRNESKVDSFRRAIVHNEALKELIDQRDHVIVDLGLCFNFFIKLLDTIILDTTHRSSLSIINIY
jgi:hypothetical protein